MKKSKSYRDILNKGCIENRDEIMHMVELVLDSHMIRYNTNETKTEIVIVPSEENKHYDIETISDMIYDNIMIPKIILNLLLEVMVVNSNTYIRLKVN